MHVLENNYLRVSINPARGGVITSIFSKSTNDEWIYYDNSRRSTENVFENYDDIWCGGFEELFPNDAPGEVQNRILKDHGELWLQNWNITDHDNNSINLQTECATVPALVSKKIILCQDQPTILINYKIKNISDEEYPFLFKLHPAMRIEQGDELQLEGGRIIQVDSSFSKIIGTHHEFNWPFVNDKSGNNKDISVIPAREKLLQEFIYVKDLKSSWCGLKRKSSNEEFILNFPGKIFPYCWFFMALGGWREHYTVVMEPCTNFPKDMITAIANGTSAFMKSFEKLEFEVSIDIRNGNADI